MSDLTENQWQAAHAIARKIVQEGANAGELKKAMAYLRTCADKPDGGTRFFEYLSNLVIGGDRIGHSKRTIDYYRGLNETCLKYLKPLQDSPDAMLEILGWAGRLIPYYSASPIAELTNAPMEVVADSAKQAAFKAIGLATGQQIEATITAIKGNKVTYELAADIKHTQKEPKKAEKLSVGQVVKVEIIEMRETGVLKKLKLICNCYEI